MTRITSLLKRPGARSTVAVVVVVVISVTMGVVACDEGGFQAQSVSPVATPVVDPPQDSTAASEGKAPTYRSDDRRAIQVAEAVVVAYAEFPNQVDLTQAQADGLATLAGKVSQAFYQQVSDSWSAVKRFNGTYKATVRSSTILSRESNTVATAYTLVSRGYTTSRSKLTLDVDYVVQLRKADGFWRVTGISQEG
jgi:hypothetical protein